MKRKYNLNDDAFILPEDDNCYWAGFLAADGSINGGMLWYSFLM